MYNLFSSAGVQAAGYISALPSRACVCCQSVDGLHIHSDSIYSCYNRRQAANVSSRPSVRLILPCLIPYSNRRLFSFFLDMSTGRFNLPSIVSTYGLCSIFKVQSRTLDSLPAAFPLGLGALDAVTSPSVAIQYHMPTHISRYISEYLASTFCTIPGASICALCHGKI